MTFIKRGIIRTNHQFDLLRGPKKRLRYSLLKENIKNNAKYFWVVYSARNMCVQTNKNDCLCFQAATRLQVWGGLADEIMGTERCDLECIELYVESIDIEKVSENKKKKDC